MKLSTSKIFLFSLMSFCCLFFMSCCFLQAKTPLHHAKCMHKVYGTCPVGHPAINRFGECDVEECPWYGGRCGGGAY